LGLFYFSIEYCLNGKDTVEYVFNIKAHYGSLNKGKYRIIKAMDSVERERMFVSVEFEIN